MMKSIRENEDGLSELIGFILILGLIMVFLSIWVVYGVPADGREQEITHMDSIQDWFTQYKITADSLWINYDPVSQDGPSDITISNSIVLGSQGGATHSQGMFLIFMRPIGSSGTISLEDGIESIEIEEDTLGTVLPKQDMMRVQYKASNNYWINQIYYYQMGGVFLWQDDGSVNRVAPLISFDPGGKANLVIINSTKGSGGDSIGGDGPVRIDTMLTSGTEEELFSGDLKIKLNLKDDQTANAWRSILIELGASNVTPPDANHQIIVDDLSEINYRYANYTVALQSVASSF